MKRRALLLSPLALLTARVRAETAFATVVPDVELSFPRDHGSHPDFRTEWWYITGWVADAQGREFGFQITFFRNRPGVNEASRSRFAPTQLLFAHAALADVRLGRLRHDQRSARAGFGLAEASLATTAVTLDDWSLELDGDTYTTRIAARDFTFALTFTATQPILLQGTRGVSRKGPRPSEASYYYSRPHLVVGGTITVEGKATSVRGTAWLDHEWSTEYLAPEASGWDWLGINFDDGRALMAFRIRAKDGGVYWAGGTLRDATGHTRTFAPEEIRFAPLREWRSPRTGVVYPIAFRVDAGPLAVTLTPLLDDQELDARGSVGTVYWEGAVRATDARGAPGRGYLELTGYGAPLKLR